MKNKTFVLCVLVLFLLPGKSPCVPDLQSFKYKAYNRISITPLQKLANKDLGFGGLYDLCHFSLSQEQMSAQVQIKFKLASSTNTQEAGIGQTIEKANVTFCPYFLKGLGVTCGTGCPLYATGCFFSVIEDYSLGGRWGKTGLSLHYLMSKDTKNKKTFGIDLGLCLPLDTGTANYKFCEKGFRLNGFLSAFYKDTAVLSFVALYDSAGNNTNLKAPYNNLYDNSTKDWCFSGFLHSNININTKQNLLLEGTIGLSWNSKPLMATPMSSSVSSAKYNDIPLYKDTSIMKAFNFWQAMLNLKLKKDKTYILLESEGGISRQQKKDFGNMQHIYTSCQVYLPLTKVLALKPHITYYSIFYSNCKKDFGSCLEVFPRFMLDFGKNSFSLGYSYCLINENHNDNFCQYSIPLWWKHSF